MNDAPTLDRNWTAARELEAHLEWLHVGAVVGYQQHSTDLTVYVRHRDEVPRVPGSFRGRRITTVVREPDYAKGTT